MKILNLKRVAGITLACLMFSQPVLASEAKVSRISGSNRYKTSLKVASEIKDFDNIILASGKEFPDALSASYLTKDGSPIILIDEKIDDATINLVKKAKNVYLVGGESTIKKEVFESLKKINSNIKRISGANRFETSLKIAESSDLNSAILTNGLDFPDALSAGPLSILENSPIILTDGNKLNENHLKALKKVKKINIVGGDSSVSKDILKNLEQNIETNRISGKNRYETSMKVAKKFKDANSIIIVSGKDYPDALSASGLSSKLGIPVLLSDSKLDGLSREYLSSRGYENIYIIGGEGSISKDFDMDIRSLYSDERREIYPSELKKLIDEDNVQIVDLRKKEDFEKGHIPGAINMNNKEFENPDNPIDGEIATAEQLVKLMESRGISSDKTIVVYSGAKKPQMAPRLIWTLRYYGNTTARLLDGHFEGWEKAGYEIEKGPAKEKESTVKYSIGELNKGINVDSDYVLNRDKNSILLDVRPTEQYEGKQESKDNKRLGHIPGALNVPYMSTVAEDGYFKPASELRKMYEAKGITKDKEIIVYCQRGHRASHTWYVLSEILGYENVKVYDGSMMEWANNDKFPIEK